MAKTKKKIVILGGGFGGLYTYKGLYHHFSKDEIEVTIVNRTNYFLFTPLLHEVATGSIAHHQVVESIRQIIYKTDDKLHVAELLSVDCDTHTVKTSVGELPYDILVVALGATTNFFNAPGAEENTMVLKDLNDAIKLRTTLIEAFEKASEITDAEARKKELTFAIIGGGPTGVELVAETAELFMDTFLKYYHGRIKCEDISLYLINSGKEILMPFHEKLRASALSTLRKNKITVMLESSVKEVRSDSLIFADGKVLPVSHVVWTAGVKPNPPMFNHEVATDQGGRITVTPTLQIPNCPDVFVIGDMASLIIKEGERSLPMLAQVAVRQGLHTSANIKRLVGGKKLKPFVYRSQGSLASLGRGNAIADIGGLHIRGPLAWFLWRTIYLFKFLSGSKKVKIVIDWTMNLFYPRDITKA